MTATLLTPEAKDALRKSVRALRADLIDHLTADARSEYQLDVSPEKARLTDAQRGRRKRLEDWLDEQVRSAGDGGTKGGKGPGAAALRARFLRQAVQEAAHTLVNRMVFVRILEHHELLGPHVATGGLRSAGYVNEFLQYAGPLASDASKGYRNLLDAVFAELALELPGLFGPVGLTALFPVPMHSLRPVLEMVNDRPLDTAWGDDTTLGWIYQYWNDPEREALDAKIASGGKIEPHEIACKTQMFTERYMVEWLLQNSLGLTWLCICQKNGWTPDAERVLGPLDARRAAFRDQREKGEVALDALMPIAPGLESDWKYYVPQPIPADAVAMAPASIRDVKLLDPACGSGHFLVIAFVLFASMYEEEARHRGVSASPEWTREAVAESIVGQNLHGVDIDPRATQIAAAGLWLKAKLHAKDARLARMNLVAPTFRLAALPKDDPARVVLGDELLNLGVPRETTARLVESLKGVDHLGTLLRVDHEIGALLEEVGTDAGPLFAHGAKRQRAALEQRVAEFLDAHAAESDLGLRLEGEQLAAGLRFVEIAKEGRYDVVVGNPPYQGLSKTAQFEYVVKNYPRGKADLYAAFLERGLELSRPGGLNAMVTMQGWMFLGQFTEMRRWILEENRICAVADLLWCAFEGMRHATVAMSVVATGLPARRPAVAIMPTERSEREESIPALARKRAAVLAQVGRYEFDPKAFAVIEGKPIVYWWTKEFLERYASASKLKDMARIRYGAITGDNVRFLRLPWEICGVRSVPLHSDDDICGSDAWVRYLKGARGTAWIDPCDCVCRWLFHGLEVKSYNAHIYRSYSRKMNERTFFQRGVAFTMIGGRFAGRAHRWRCIVDGMASSVFTDKIADITCLLNTSRSRFVLESLNPTIHFEVADVSRLPAWTVDLVDKIYLTIEHAFGEHEASRETSLEFRATGPSSWRSSQDWAQRAVDRADGAVLPLYEPELDLPAPEAHVSFAIGVALGRFGASGEGILDAAPKTALPAGILLVGPDDAHPDSLTHAAAAPILAAWDAYLPETGKKPTLRDWLRKDFFAFHKSLYENRPIYFPLSSEKKTFVAWVSIHRWTDATLSTLLADHLHPVLRQLDAEIRDVNAARTSSDKKTAIAADKQYATAKRMRDELADFIAAVTECAERGAPPADPGGPKREVDATFHMDLDDGVMINSAALWPLLAPQWSDPKKWWKQLCLAEGRKDYDWAHLAKRYFPARVDAKCIGDPSLAVAHGCFWKYHPAKAYAWELRLQDEIRADFTIDEDGSDDARAAYLRGHAADAEAAREKERVRRERKAAKQADDEATDEDGASEGEGDDG